MERFQFREIPGPTDLRVSWLGVDRNTVVVRIQGPLDSNTAQDFEIRLKSLFEPMPEHLLMDLGRVDYLSSMGLTAILKYAIQLKKAGFELAVYDPPLSVRRVLEISKWDQIILDSKKVASDSAFFGYVCDEEPARQVRRNQASSVPPRLFQV
jgi:anti-sigma B factor antagonist